MTAVAKKLAACHDLHSDPTAIVHPSMTTANEHDGTDIDRSVKWYAPTYRSCFRRHSFAVDVSHERPFVSCVSHVLGPILLGRKNQDRGARVRVSAASVQYIRRWQRLRPPTRVYRRLGDMARAVNFVPQTTSSSGYGVLASERARFWTCNVGQVEQRVV